VSRIECQEGSCEGSIRFQINNDWKLKELGPLDLLVVSCEFANGTSGVVFGQAQTPDDMLQHIEVEGGGDVTTGRNQLVWTVLLLKLESPNSTATRQWTLQASRMAMLLVPSNHL
jgi:hypothetical protein